MSLPSRTYWTARSLNQVADEPWLVSLLRYCKRCDVRQAREEDATLTSSLTWSGRQAPIIDLDVPHHFEASSTSGHTHLYLDYEIPKWRWQVLQLALWLAKVQEPGYSVWSLRRGANFVRLPGVVKRQEETNVPVRYGWFRRL